MSWVNIARAFAARSVASAAAVAALALATPAVAGVVVKSSGPSQGKYPVGMKLKDTGTITLEEGDSVTVLNANGTRVITGPGRKRVGARGAQTKLRYDQLTRVRSATRVRTGAARAGSGEVRSPNLWFVDVTQSGKMCVPDLADVTLWRPTSEGEQTYILGPSASEYHYHVVFDDGMMVRPVDNDRLPLQSGSAYTISGPGGAASTEVTIAQIDAAADDPEGMADLLIANGCELQLGLLADSLLATGR